MGKSNKWYIHLGLVVAMLAVACVYMLPALGGKVIVQGDMQKADAMAYQQKKVQEATGSVPTWNSSMFGGMPGYQTATEPPKTAFQPLRNLLIMRPFGVERNIGVLFLYLLGFYVAMLAFGVSPWLALVGALGFGLGSYNIIIIEAGHITKAWAMAFMAPVFGGMVMTLRAAFEEDDDRRRTRRHMLWGTLLFTVALILQIACNHIQITFYTAVGCGAIGVAYLVLALVRHRLPRAAAGAGLLVLGAALAFGCNVRLLLVNEEYARYTMRGGNELNVTPADLYGEREATAAQNTATGLDIDYAFNWSYGIGETYTLLVPGAMGGGSGEKVGRESAFYKTFRSERAPLYWGDQPFTSGPVYFGAIIVMLFLLGLIVTKGPDRWWLLAATLLAVLLSWGSNLMGLNGWVFEHVPFYNKFRTPSMALVLANACMAILAVLALRAVLDEGRDRRLVNRGLYVAAGCLAAVILGVMAMSGSFSFSGVSDEQMAAQYGDNWPLIKDTLVSDRASLLRSDSWRSLLLIVAAAAVLWLYNNDKLKKGGIALAAIGVLVLVDLWGVDRRYLDSDNFVEKRSLELRRDQWDYDIDEQAARFGDRDFRVLNLAVNTFNDSKPSAFHNQIGGYSAAKLSRYQNLIDFYLSRHINPQVLSMLNTRYVVMQNGQVQRLPEAMGNCWFVDGVRAVGGPDEEILALNSTDLASTAVVDTSRYRLGLTQFVADSTDRIALMPEKTMNPDYLRYESHTSADRLAVFSEIHYAPDWFAYVDGKPAEYVCADYVLRAMVVPAGDHVVEFRNEAPRMHRLDRWGLGISVATLLLMLGAVAWTYLPRRKESAE